ncbi:MAG: cation-transporting P-type ATPase, partial [Candidatus Atribacteria bacterium]|nr:cation-transporting P-type ATPase [Candidatus Atribacteria bacterium]
MLVSLNLFLTTAKRLTEVSRHHTLTVSKKIVESSQAEIPILLDQYRTSLNGLEDPEVALLQEEYGPNEVTKGKRQSFLERLFDNVKNPLVILLVVLGVISYLTGDIRATVMIGVMVLLGMILRFFQELRADHAAEKLQAMVSTTATVVRSGKKLEVPLKELVPGDIILLSAGDMVPADVRLLSA